MHSQLYHDLPIVDAHRHLWMSSGEHADQGDNSAFRRSYLSQQHRRDMALPASKFQEQK